MRTLLLVLILMSISIAGNICKGIKIEKGFGSTIAKEDLNVGEGSFDNRGYLVFEKIDLRYYLTVYIYEKDVHHVTIDKGHKLLIELAEQTILTLNSEEVTKPEIVLPTSASPRTEWNVKYELSEDIFEKLANKRISKYRIEGYKKTNTIAVTDKQNKKIKKIYNCFMCDECF